MNNPVFTPHKGLMSIGESLANRFGLGALWGGEEGLGAVVARKLDDAGVPRQVAITPLAVAESAGIVKQSKRRKG